MGKKHREKDKEIGINIKLFREAGKLTQEQLGWRVDLTSQQIGRYERGEDSIAAALLFKVNKELKTNIADYF